MVLEVPGGRGGRRGAISEWMLFNLEDDPGERTDLAEQYPGIRDELVELMPR